MNSRDGCSWLMPIIECLWMDIKEHFLRKDNWYVVWDYDNNYDYNLKYFLFKNIFLFFKIYF
jgi:hypothetical protein